MTLEKFKFTLKQVGKTRWIVDGLTQAEWIEIVQSLAEVSEDPEDVSIRVGNQEMMA